MKDDKFVAYYRVSTQKQGASGLGLEGQRFSVAAHIANAGGELVGEFEEVETGGGANALKKRPRLAAALALCKKEKATLVIAKLDRLARNIHFVSGLLESKVSFIACDMPLADKTMIQIYAVMSEWERDACKARTKAAWHANAARKILNGEAVPNNLKTNIEARQIAAHAFADALRPVFADMSNRGLTQRAMMSELNENEVPTATNGKEWGLIQVQRVIKRLKDCPPSQI